MAPASGRDTASSRWGDAEHDILVQMTNDQLELEYADESTTISWHQHWKLVASRLQDQGYNRTVGACKGYWKRSIDLKKAFEQAAGPRWDDYEHQILVRMTNDQLELEKANPAAIIPWARHWKNVSFHLREENGYHRTSGECSAYWTLFQSDCAHATGSGNGADLGTQPSEERSEVENEDEDYFPAALGDTSTQKSTKFQLWANEEHENLLRLLKNHREVDEKNGVEPLSGLRLWTYISLLHQQCGFDRTWECCKSYWQNFGRSKSGFDERQIVSFRSGVDRRSTGSQPLSPLSASAPLNELEDATLKYFEKDISHSEVSSLGNQMLSSDMNLVFTNSRNTTFSDSDASEHESNQAREGSITVNIPNTNPKSTWPFVDDGKDQQNEKRFRFKGHEREFLEAEAANNGSSPSTERRQALAAKLGVDEKRIRNWFSQFRFVQKRREFVRAQGSDVIRVVRTPPSSILDASLGDEVPLTNSGTNRNHSWVNSPAVDSIAKDDPPGYICPFKRPRLQDPSGKDNVNQTHFASNIAEDRPENINPTNNLKHKTPVRDMPETNVNGGRVSPEKPAMLYEEQGPQISMDRPTANFPDFSSSATNTVERSGIAAILNESTEIGSSQVQQGNPATQPISAVETSQTSGRMTRPSEEHNQATTQPPTAPPIQHHGPPTDEQQKAWASAQVQTFLSDIQSLNRSSFRQASSLNAIQVEMDNIKKEGTKLFKDQEEEIARATSEIRARYNRTHMEFKSKLDHLSQMQGNEEEGLRKNAAERQRVETGMKRFEAIVDFYNSVGDGS